MNKRAVTVGLGILSGVAALRLSTRRKCLNLAEKVVFVTGGSRGLGLLLAREFVQRGARVAISARDGAELKRAADRLQVMNGTPVLALEADMTMREEAEAAIERTREHFGPVEVLVNNAGTITVGPVEVMTIDDYRESVNTHFWGPFFAVSAVLPDMQKRKSGRIVNISSIGGKISVPHLLPYSVGKFALTGFSEGLRAELRKDNILVTTVCPGLMRTGSPCNALFKGHSEDEYAWFSVSNSIPGVSMNARSAAKRIVKACERGEPEIVLSISAKLAVEFHDLMPGLTTDLLSVVNRMLPSAKAGSTAAQTGAQSSSSISTSWATALSDQAAEQNNEVA